MQSKSEFEIAQAGSIPDFKILSPASYPSAPLSPKKSVITGAGFVASFGFIFFFIGILYVVNNRVTGVYDLERLRQIPILGVVPASRYSSNGGIFVAEHPRSMVSEAIRTLRTNLEFFNIQADKKIIAVSSTVSGEGKSFIAMNLGGVIALSRKKVVLLDLDMRKPKHDLPAPFNENTKAHKHHTYPQEQLAGVHYKNRGRIVRLHAFGTAPAQPLRSSCSMAISTSCWPI